MGIDGNFFSHGSIAVLVCLLVDRTKRTEAGTQQHASRARPSHPQECGFDGGSARPEVRGAMVNGLISRGSKRVLGWRLQGERSPLFRYYDSLNDVEGSWI